MNACAVDMSQHLIQQKSERVDEHTGSSSNLRNKLLCCWLFTNSPKKFFFNLTIWNLFQNYKIGLIFFIIKNDFIIKHRTVRLRQSRKHLPSHRRYLTVKQNENGHMKTTEVCSGLCVFAAKCKFMHLFSDLAQYLFLNYLLPDNSGSVRVGFCLALFTLSTLPVVELDTNELQEL